MAGIEIIGVVLGTIPLVISAIEHYQTFQLWRRFPRELKSLALQLRVQHCILKNTCEMLLNGITPMNDVAPMIEEPFGSLWQEKRIKCKVEARLMGDNYAVFETTVRHMGDALDELKRRLDLTPDGQVKCNERGAMLRELKYAGFTFKRAQFKDLMNIIKDGNEALKTLTEQNILLEPSRHSRFRGVFLNLLRDVSQNVYNAICNSLSCTCLQYHAINLELKPPPRTTVTSSPDKRVTESFQFNITLSTKLEDTLAKQANVPWDWEEVVLMLLPKTQQPAYKKPTPSKGKQVKFSTSSDAPEVKVVDSIHVVSSAFASLEVGVPGENSNNTAELSDLCHALGQSRSDISNNAHGVACYGYVTDRVASEYNRFVVLPTTVVTTTTSNISTDWTGISLRELLSQEAASRVLRGLTASCLVIPLEAKLKLAYWISFGVLQLSKTLWLSDKPTSEDIILLHLDKDHRTFILWDRAFVRKKPAEPTAALSPKSTGIRGQTVVSLGIILLELILEATLDTFRNPDERRAQQISESRCDSRCSSSLKADADVARRLLDRVAIEGGPNYGEVVRRCINCEFNSPDADLDNDRFRQELYCNVVAPLEANIQLF